MSRLSRQRLNAFLDMLAAERGAARNTLEAYERDIEDYLGFLGGRAPADACAEDIRGWLVDLAARGLKASSAARRLSAIRQFHRFL
ncbi:site-specific integrase, partial [Bosea sp. CER48]|uniref:site-specific integrase n=1 Tax=Bosea sp. CER48 TaxID=3377035 RepID=UPI0037F8E626